MSELAVQTSLLSYGLAVTVENLLEQMPTITKPTRKCNQETWHHCRQGMCHAGKKGKKGEKGAAKGSADKPAGAKKADGKAASGPAQSAGGKAAPASVNSASPAGKAAAAASKPASASSTGLAKTGK